MGDTPTAEQRAAEAARKWLDQREWVEDCTCADDPEGQCWYHLTAWQKGESRIKSATDAFANFAEDLLAALSTVEAERDRLRDHIATARRMVDILCTDCEHPEYHADVHLADLMEKHVFRAGQGNQT